MSDTAIPTYTPRGVAKILLTCGGGQNHPCGQAVLWVGAGASLSAGIPSGRELAGRLAHRLAVSYRYVQGDPDDEDPVVHNNSFNILRSKKDIAASHTLGSAYGELFSKLAPIQQREFIRTTLAKSSGRRINWAHLAIGELVRQRFVHTVLTTNFDDLVLDGIVRCDILPAIVDGIESLNRVDPRPPVPQLVYLHGSQHTYNPRNSTEDVKGTSFHEASQALYGVLADCSVLIVVGYAGNPNEGVMELLLKASAARSDLNVCWVSFSQQDALSEMATQLLRTGTNKRLIPGQDADAFFVELLGEMQIGAPSWMSNPILHLAAQAKRINVSQAPQAFLVQGVVKDYQERLKEILPEWENMGEKQAQKRTLIQLAMSNEYAAIWMLLKEQKLDDPELLRIRADAALKLGDEMTKESMRQAVDDSRVLLASVACQSTDWAGLQKQYGKALAMLGNTKDRIALEQAIDAYSAALRVYKREKLWPEWARTISDIGSVQGMLGGLGDRDALKSALSSYKRAMSVFRKHGMPQECAWTLANMGNIRYTMGLQEDKTGLKDAISLYLKALEVKTEAADVEKWLMIMVNLGMAHLALSSDGDEAELNAAAECFDRVLDRGSDRPHSPTLAMAEKGKTEVTQGFVDLKRGRPSLSES